MLLVKPILYLPYTIPHLDRCEYTFQWYHENKMQLRDMCQIYTWPCRIPLDYWRGIKELWGYATIIIMEHDVIPTLDMIRKLISCEHDICGQEYFMWFTGLKDDNRLLVGKSIFRDFHYDKGTDSTYLLSTATTYEKRYRYDTTKEYFDFGALGLSKISEGFQHRYKFDIKPTEWSKLDSGINHYIMAKGYKWHCHRPLCDHSHYPDWVYATNYVL